MNVCDICQQPVGRGFAAFIGPRCRRDYCGSCMPGVIAALDRLEGSETPQAARESELDEQRRRHQRWHETPQLERERHALEVLGEGRMKLREFRDALRAYLPDCAIEDSNTQALLYALLEAGEIDREHVRVGNVDRWRYFRRTELRGPIADLARQLEGEAT